MTLASVWSGRPQITELADRAPGCERAAAARAREANPPPRPAAAGAGGRSRSSMSASPAARWCSPICATASRTGSRPSTPTPPSAATARSRSSGNARAAGEPLKFEIKATAPAPPIERQNIPTEFKIDAPGLLQAPLSGKAEVRLNGSVVMINGLSGTLGDGAFNGWASVDLASKPLVKLDLDFQRLGGRDAAWPRRCRRRSPGAMPRSISTASIMSTRRRGFPRPSSISATAASRRPRSRPRSQAAC